MESAHFNLRGCDLNLLVKVEHSYHALYFVQATNAQMVQQFIRIHIAATGSCYNLLLRCTLQLWVLYG